jgi:hypothetical protein
MLNFHRQFPHRGAIGVGSARTRFQVLCSPSRRFIVSRLGLCHHSFDLQREIEKQHGQGQGEWQRQEDGVDLAFDDPDKN